MSLSNCNLFYFSVTSCLTIHILTEFYIQNLPNNNQYSFAQISPLTNYLVNEQKKNHSLPINPRCVLQLENAAILFYFLFYFLKLHLLLANKYHIIFFNKYHTYSRLITVEQQMSVQNICGYRDQVGQMLFLLKWLMRSQVLIYLLKP